MDFNKEQVVCKWNVFGRLYVLFDGCFIVILYKFVNEIVNVFFDSKVYVLFIFKVGSILILKFILDIFMGVSELVYVKKIDQ